MSKIRIFVRYLIVALLRPSFTFKKVISQSIHLMLLSSCHLFAYVLFFLFCQLCRCDTTIFLIAFYKSVKNQALKTLKRDEMFFTSSRPNRRSIASSTFFSSIKPDAFLLNLSIRSFSDISIFADSPLCE